MKAVALFSGGLDSLLAIKLIQAQGIKVVAVAFRSPFFISSEEKKKQLEEYAKKQKFEIKFVDLDKDYLKMLIKPKHGYGKNLNPCIDCHAYMIRKAKKIADKIGAKFVFTGEVLNERPMSQNKQSLEIVEKEAGLKGKLLRPLSAQVLPETEAEKKGFVDRSKLKSISGRSRRRQFGLAKRFGIKDFETPGGGCLLTHEEFTAKLRDLFEHNKKTSISDCRLLKFGRHFRSGKNKIIVGRNKADNDQLVENKIDSDYMFEAKDVPGPITLLQGPKTKKAIELAASLTALYSDAEQDKVKIIYGMQKFNKEIIINKISDKEAESLRIKHGQ